VSEYICQLHYIPYNSVKRYCKQMPQVMVKYFFRHHTRSSAQGLHFLPDLFSGQLFSRPGQENTACPYFSLFCILQKPPAQFFLDQDGSYLSLQRNIRPPCPCRLYRNVFHLRNANPGITDAFHQKMQTLSSLSFCCFQKLFIFFPCQFFFPKFIG